MSTKNLIIAFGGVSPEHEVSVLSAIQAISSMENSQYNLVPLYISKSGKWFTGNQLLELETYKDLSLLEENALQCAFVKDDIGRTHLKQQNSAGLFSKPKSYPVYAVV